MLKISLGEMLKRFRIEKGVEARQVCEGLCSQGMMSYYEKGEVAPDTLLFECMMERMGVSSELFSMMVSREEYEYYEWKERVCQAIGERDKEKLRELLSSKIVTKSFCNKKLEKQFLLYTRAILCGMDEQYDKATVMLEEAMKQTIVDLKMIQKTKALLSAMELHILMLYLYYGVLSGVIQQNDGKMMFDLLEKYIGSETLDLIIRAKLYPKLCCIGFALFEKRLSECERIMLCENAISLMKKDLSFHEITNVLYLYIPILEKIGSVELKFYKKQCEVFEDILKCANIDTQFYVECLPRMSPKFYIIDEYLLSERRLNELTQEQLCDGICEPESYSRIETGKRSPSYKNLKGLIERLDIKWCYYRGELDTCNLRSFELRGIHRIKNIYGKYEESLDILETMKKNLDMSSDTNYQYITYNKLYILWRMGKIELDEVCNKLQELFDMTCKKKISVSEMVYYSQTELEMVGRIGQMLRYLGNVQKGIEFLEKIIEQMRNSQVKIESQWNSFDFLLRVLSGLYFGSGDYNRSIKIAEYVKNENVHRRNADSLSWSFDAIADSLEHLGEQYSDVYKKLYRYTFYVSDFFEIAEVADSSKRFYQDHFEPGMIWY